MRRAVREHCEMDRDKFLRIEILAEAQMDEAGFHTNCTEISHGHWKEKMDFFKSLKYMN